MDVFGTRNIKLLLTCRRGKEFSKIRTVGYLNVPPVKLVNSSNNVRRRWLTGKWAKELSLELALEPGEFSSIIDRLVGHLVARMIQEHTPLVDIKGRDAEVLLAGADQVPTNDELFHLEGRLAVEQRGNNYIWEHFHVTARTKFLDFTEANQIRHELSVEHSKNIPLGFPVESIGRAISIDPSFFRLGIDRFKPSFFSAMLGAWPTVVDSLLIDCSSQKLLAIIRSDALPKRATEPFHGTDIVAALESAIGWKIVKG